MQSHSAGSREQPLVWPGVSAMWQQHQQQKTPLCNSNQRQFSFDWHKGLSSSSLRDATKGKQSVPFLSSFNYGDGFTFTSRQRWRPFISLLLLSALMFVLAGLFLPLVLLRPHKFCLFFTMGSMLSMASFAVLRGPLEQCKHMFSMARCARARLPMCTQRRRRSQQQQKQRQQQQRQRQQQQHSSSRACSSSGPSPAAQPCSAALQRSSAAQQRSSSAAQLPSSPAATRRGRLRANGLAVCFCRLVAHPCPPALSTQAAVHEHVPWLDAAYALRGSGAAELPACHPLLDAAGLRGLVVHALVHPRGSTCSEGHDARRPQGGQRALLQRVGFQ